MKKFIAYLFAAILSIFIFLVGFEDKKNIAPNQFYKVYLDDQILGVIKNKEDLLNYIDKEGSNIKEKYKVDRNVHIVPTGIEVDRFFVENMNKKEVPLFAY